MKAIYKEEHSKNIIDLKKNIEYSKDSIVSKVFVKRGDTSVTLFAFDKDQKIDTHTAPVEAFVQILEGEAQINISDKDYFVKEGEFILMPSKEPHSLFAVTQFKMLLFKI